ncbi:MAG: hypothetical protein JW776_05960 [Candidatus Lokiarchaeota archaeon]|nr:hypothetical protein [Candidatus Lokiarchaeota archaeon]
MSQMITDLMNNIYTRISQMGSAISKLQKSLDGLNSLINTKIEELVQTTVSMKENNEKESKTFELILRGYGDAFLQEINRLKSNIGLKDLDELVQKLKKISEASEEPLKPENVDLLLDEVLVGIKKLMGPSGEDPKTDAPTAEKKQGIKGQSIQPEGFNQASPPSK